MEQRKSKPLFIELYNNSELKSNASELVGVWTNVLLGPLVVSPKEAELSRISLFNNIIPKSG